MTGRRYTTRRLTQSSSTAGTTWTRRFRRTSSLRQRPPKRLGGRPVIPVLDECLDLDGLETRVLAWLGTSTYPCPRTTSTATWTTPFFVSESAHSRSTRICYDPVLPPDQDLTGDSIPVTVVPADDFHGRMREVRPVVSTKAVRDHASLGLIPGLQVVNRSAELCAHCRQHGPEQERVRNESLSVARSSAQFSGF